MFNSPIEYTVLQPVVRANSIKPVVNCHEVTDHRKLYSDAHASGSNALDGVVHEESNKGQKHVLPTPFPCMHTEDLCILLKLAARTCVTTRMQLQY